VIKGFLIPISLTSPHVCGWRYRWSKLVIFGCTPRHGMFRRRPRDQMLTDLDILSSFRELMVECLNPGNGILLGGLCSLLILGAGCKW
jgi:hypothetical protein